MWDFLVKNASTVIIGAVLLAVVALIIANLRKKAKRGGCVGCVGCDGCGKRRGCHDCASMTEKRKK